MGEYVQQDSSSGSRAGGFLAGLLMGGLVSAGAMLLMAPQSGKATRDAIRKEGIDLRDRTVRDVEGAVEQVRGKARDVTAGVRERTEELQHEGQEMLDKQKERASTAIEATKDAILGY